MGGQLAGFSGVLSARTKTSAPRGPEPQAFVLAWPPNFLGSRPIPAGAAVIPEEV